MQLDMHFYGVYAMARSAGLNPETAETIAYASQFVDDAIHDDHVLVSNNQAIVPTISRHKPLDYQNAIPGDQWKICVPFHFLPGNDPKGDLVFGGRPSDGNSFEERLRITPDGLTFNGDTAADNALSDYEQGTFNVTFSGATVSVGSDVANYTKIGNMVYWRYYTGVSTISSSSSSLILGGLPYNVANVHGNYSGVNVGINTFFGSSVTNGQKAYHQINTDYIYFSNPSTISSPAAVNGSSKYLMVGGFYQAA